VYLKCERFQYEEQISHEHASENEWFFELKDYINNKYLISVFEQLDAQILFHNKFYFMPLHVSSTCAHHQEIKIALNSLWYHHTYRWPSRARDGHLQV